MVLYSDLKDFKIYSQIGEERGKITGLIVDLNDWKVKNLIVSPRMLKKKVIYKMDDLKEVKEHEKKIIIPGEINGEEIPEEESLSSAILDDVIIHKMVVSKDGHEIGKIYDLDIPLKLKHWMVWKILVKRGIKERRLRVGPEDIDNISENIMLKKSISEIEEHEEEEK